MNTEEWSRLSAAFDELCDLEPAPREARLNDLDTKDPSLAAVLRAMLAVDATPHGPLGEGPLELGGTELVGDLAGGQAPATAGPEVAAATRLGPWRLLERLGEGGMGEVWAAERADGAFEQQVAIKLMRRGLETEGLLRRFLRERQILARLVHPGIARMLDAGSTHDGRPYFVMERVAGEPITTWAQARGLTLEARLRLVLAICEAVGFAHRNLVVHRDLKPSNVLVSESGEVKLLDFGIAKLLEREEEGTQLTELEGRLLTPSYAAPEQIRGETVTTATDVYALGVLLYELLTGRLPHQRESVAISALAAQVERETVERPSTAVRAAGEVGAVGGFEPAKLARRLSGDLDTIVLTALRREPERRYASVEKLAEDLRRYLTGQPVSARPDTFGYRAGKLLRRHALASTALALAVLAIGLLTAFYAVRLAHERDRARLEAAKAQQASAFLASLFELSNLDRTKGVKLSLRDVVDRGAATLSSELTEQPDVAATMMELIGTVYRQLGVYEQAQPLLERALRIRQQSLGTQHPDVAASLHKLGVLLQARGNYAAARSYYQRSVDTYAAALGPDHPDGVWPLRSLAGLLYSAGDYAAAQPLYERALAVREAAYGPEHPEVADSAMDLANDLYHRRQYVAAERLYRRAVAVRRAVLPPGDERLGFALGALGDLLCEQGRREEAAPLLREGRDLMAAARPAGDPERVEAETLLAQCTPTGPTSVVNH